MRLSFAVLVPLALLLGGCAERPGVTEPPPATGFSVSIAEARPLSVIHGTDESGSPVYGCDFRLIARATGGGPGMAATLHSARIDQQRTSALPPRTLEYGAAEVALWFGMETIPTGASVQAERRVTWSYPFNLTITLRFTLPDGDVRSSSASFVCGG
jgi:hypothetical protein